MVIKQVLERLVYFNRGLYLVHFTQYKLLVEYLILHLYSAIFVFMPVVEKSNQI